MAEVALSRPASNASKMPRLTAGDSAKSSAQSVKRSFMRLLSRTKYYTWRDAGGKNRAVRTLIAGGSYKSAARRRDRRRKTIPLAQFDGSAYVLPAKVRNAAEPE
jgi:hypothetical protein